MLSCSLALLRQRKVFLGEAGALNLRKSRKISGDMSITFSQSVHNCFSCLRRMGTVGFPFQLAPLSLIACVCCLMVLPVERVACPLSPFPPYRTHCSPCWCTNRLTGRWMYTASSCLGGHIISVSSEVWGKEAGGHSNQCILLASLNCVATEPRPDAPPVLGVPLPVS